MVWLGLVLTLVVVGVFVLLATRNRRCLLVVSDLAPAYAGRLLT